MAVTVTDLRTTLYSDGLTGITGADTVETGFFAEAVSSAAVAYNIATGQIYFGTTLNTTTAGNELLYVWSAIVATQNSYKEATAADSSHAQYIGDGTNNFIVYQAGNDRDVFKHADGQVSFQCFLIDMDYLTTADTNGDIAFLNGTLASLNEAAITRIGAHYTTLSKALGGGNNCYMDIIRYGTEGIRITGGTTGARGNFEEICIEDRSSADGKAHGVIREYTPGAYGTQGTLKFGNTAAGTSWFEDTGAAVTFEDRLVADDKFRLLVEGNVTGGNETHFILRNTTISSARPAVGVDMSSTGINELVLENCSFLNLRNAFALPTDTVSGSYTHTVSGCSFTNVGLVNQGSVPLVDCTFNNATDALGAIELDTSAQSNGSSGLSFASDGTGHAIYITTTGTYSFTDFTYTGYAGTNGSTGNEVVYNNSGGLVTINVTGGGTPTIRNGAGASTVVNNNVGVTIVVSDTAGNFVVGAVVGVYRTSDDLLIINDETDTNGEVTGTTGASTAFYVRVRKSTTGTTRYIPVSTTGNSGATGSTLFVTLAEDVLVEL